MPTLTLTSAQLVAVRDALDILSPDQPSLCRVRDAALAAVSAALAPRPPILRLVKAPAKGHDRCVHHEPIALDNLATRVLCFDAKPTPRELAARVKFATFIDALIAKRRRRRPVKGTGKWDRIDPAYTASKGPGGIPVSKLHVHFRCQVLVVGDINTYANGSWAVGKSRIVAKGTPDARLVCRYTGAPVPKARKVRQAVAA